MATQETIKQLFSGGVLRDIEDADARQAITALQNALNALTSGDTTTAIENFQEVIDFLDGVTDDETLIGKITALQTAINGKQPMLTFDNAPTAGSNNPVKSGGVKTALDAKVNTETGKGLSSNDYTDADRAAVGAIASKANDSEVVKSISVNGGNPQTPTQGNVNINVQGAAGDDGITPQIGANGNWFIGDTDTTVHAQGPAGTSYTSADLEIGNALNGEGDVLGMGGAMKLKNNIDAVQANLVKLYNKLANMAFWDAEDQADAEPIPTSLDWSVPKKTVTLALSLNNAVVKHNGQEVSSSVQVDEGSGLMLTVEPASGYALTGAPTVSNGATVNDLGNGTYSVNIASVDADMTLSISATAAAPVVVTIDNQVGAGIVIKQGASVITGNSVNVAPGGTLTLTVEAAEDYEIDSMDAEVGGDSLQPTESGGVYTIVASNISSNITIVITGQLWKVAPKSDTTSVYGVQMGSINITSGLAVIDANNATILCPRCVTDPLNNNSPAGNSAMNFYGVEGNTFHLKMKPLESGCYALNLAYYGSDFSYISRDSYKDVGVNENWETSFNVPANTAYVKVLICTRNTYGGTVQNMSSFYAAWDNTTMKYR